MSSREVVGRSKWWQVLLWQEVEKRMFEEKKKMVTFIAGVINVTADVKSKSERIHICNSLKLNCLVFVSLLFLIISPVLFIIVITNSQILPVHALMFPSHVSVFL